VLAALACLVLFWFLSSGESHSVSTNAPSAQNKATNRIANGDLAQSIRTLVTAPAEYDGQEQPGESTLAEAKEELLGLLGRLRSGAQPQEVRESLRRLKKLVHAAAPDEAAAAIISLLESGQDAPTGLGFVVGPEGVMDESPTWRTALLDFLGQTDPTQFIAYSRVLLGTTSSPDEYALSLRNLGWGNINGRFDGEIRGYFAAMLARPDWKQQPTVGYLEAFDLAVESGAMNEVASVLSAGTAEGEPVVSRAAFVALDRIMLNSPDKLVGRFASDPQFLSSAPIHRASLLSRLDVRKPAQANLLARYLQRGDHAPGELEYFFDLFPNGNRFASNRLVTTPEGGGSIADMQELDRASLETLRGWMAKPEFASYRDELAKIVARLEDTSLNGDSN